MYTSLPGRLHLADNFSADSDAAEIQPAAGSIWHAHSALKEVIDSGVMTHEKWTETGLPARRYDYIQNCRNHAALAYADSQPGLMAGGEGSALSLNTITEQHINDWHNGIDSEGYHSISEQARTGWNELAGIFMGMQEVRSAHAQNGADSLATTLRNQLEKGKGRADQTEPAPSSATNDDMDNDDMAFIAAFDFDPEALFLDSADLPSYLNDSTIENNTPLFQEDIQDALYGEPSALPPATPYFADLSAITHTSTATLAPDASTPVNDEHGICLTRKESFFTAMSETADFARRKKIKLKDAVQELDKKVAHLNSLQGKTGTIDPEAARARYLQLTTPAAGEKRIARFPSSIARKSAVERARNAAASIRDTQARSLIKGQATAHRTNRNRIYTSKKIDWTTVHTLNEVANAVFLSCKNGKVGFGSPPAIKYLQAGLDYLKELHNTPYEMSELDALYSDLTSGRVMPTEDPASLR